MLRCRKIFLSGSGAEILLAAIVLGLAQMTQAVTVSGAATAGVSSVPAGSLIMTGAQNSRPAGTCSRNVTEIIRMLDAKVDAQVIIAYIKNSSTVSQPEASEMIALKEHGATSELQLALVNRGGELRQQYIEAMQAMQKQAAAARGATQAPVVSEPAVPAYAYPQTAAYPDYPVSYVYPDSYYYTPYYYSSYPYYRSGFSYSYWPSFYCGLGFNRYWNNGRWCWTGNRNFGHVNNSFCWNGNRWNGSHWNSGFNTRSTPRVSHAAFAPVRSAPAVGRSGGGRSFSGGMHVAAGGGGVRGGRR